MCGRYAASREPGRPRRGVRDRRGRRAEGERSTPDYNVAPTNRCYAVVERAAARTSPRTRSRCAGCVPCTGAWCRPGPRTPRSAPGMINARAESLSTSRPSGGRSPRRCLLPGRRLLRVVGRRERTPASRQAAVLHPARETAAAGDGRPLRVLARPDPRRATTRRPGWDLHRDHHRRRGRARPHPRPDAAVVERSAADVARPAVEDPDALRGLLCRPPRAGSTAYPVSTRVNNVRNNGPELIEPLPVDERLASMRRCEIAPAARTIATPGGDARVVRPAAGTRGTLVLGHGAGGGSARGPAAVRRGGCRRRLAWCGSSSRGGWPAAGRAPRPRAGRRLARGARRLRWTRPAPARWWSAAAAPGRGWPAGRRRELGAARRARLAFPLHPPGRPEKSRAPS